MTKTHAIRLSAALVLTLVLASPVSASPLVLDPTGDGILSTLSSWILETAEWLGWNKSGCSVDPNGCPPTPPPTAPAGDGGETESGCSVDPNGTPCTPKP